MNDSSSLFYDLYQLTMSQSYWRAGREPTAIFELYIRDMPSNRGYIVLNGIRQALDAIRNLNFQKSDMDALNSLERFDPKFIDYLGNIEFTGTVRGMQDGDIIFAEEPVLQVQAPIIQGQLLETMLINCVNYSSLVATKCSRVKYSAGPKEIVDFGARRAHGKDAANTLARAGYLTGFQGTATVTTGVNFSIPMFGTMAHSYIMAFENEIDAFRSYAKEFPNTCTLLVDTYDTLSGVKNAVTVAKELELTGNKLRAIRLDSGDYLKLSVKARHILNSSGLNYVDIVASGGLDEYRIKELEIGEAPIDIYGVGTKIAVSEDAPWLESVYKMVEIDSRPVNKSSDGKKSYPYKKNILRKHDSKGNFVEDFVLSGQNISDYDGCTSLLSTYIEHGKTIKEHSGLTDSRSHHQEQFAKLDDCYKSISQPHKYPVSMNLE